MQSNNKIKPYKTSRYWDYTTRIKPKDETNSFIRSQFRNIKNKIDLLDDWIMPIYDKSNYAN